MELICTIKEYQLFAKFNWQCIKSNEISDSFNYIGHMFNRILNQWILISIDDFAGTNCIKIYWTQESEDLLAQLEARIILDWELLKKHCAKRDHQHAKNFCARYIRAIRDYGDEYQLEE